MRLHIIQAIQHFNCFIVRLDHGSCFEGCPCFLLCFFFYKVLKGMRYSDSLPSLSLTVIGNHPCHAIQSGNRRFTSKRWKSLGATKVMMPPGLKHPQTQRGVAPKPRWCCTGRLRPYLTHLGPGTACSYTVRWSGQNTNRDLGRSTPIGTWVHPH